MYFRKHITTTTVFKYIYYFSDNPSKASLAPRKYALKQKKISIRKIVFNV